MTKCLAIQDKKIRVGVEPTKIKPLPVDPDDGNVGLSPLGLAAKLVETTAYEVAGTASTSLVSELILISARLSTIDEQIDPARRR